MVRLATRKGQLLAMMPAIAPTIIQVSGRARPQASAIRLINNKEEAV